MSKLLFIAALITSMGAATTFAQGPRANTSANTQTATRNFQPQAAGASFTHTAAQTVTANSRHAEGATRQPLQPVKYATKGMAQGQRTTMNNTYSKSYTNRNNVAATGSYAMATSTDAGGNISWRLKANPAIIITGGTTRYNWAAKKKYPYYTSGLSKKRAEAHYFDLVRVKRPHPRFSTLNYGMFYCMLYLSCEYFYDDLIYEIETSNPDDAAEEVSFDGYIVYNSDTLSGIVTIDERRVTLEKTIDSAKEHTYGVALTDSNLKGIALFSGAKELYLTRLSPDDKKLWRVLHTGQLNVYDDNYRFPQTGFMGKGHLKISYAGNDGTTTVKNTKQLTNAVNNAYGLHLNAHNYGWTELMTYISKLD